MAADDPVLWRTASGREIRGSTLRSVIAVYRAALTKHKNDLKPSEINNILVKHLIVGGEFWIRTFLPMRFDPAYARGVLGYVAKKQYEEWKVNALRNGGPADFRRGFIGIDRQDLGGDKPVMAPQPTPFMLTGSSRATVMNSARAEAIVKSTRAVLRIRCSPGAISFTKQYAAFLKLPAIEYARTMEVIQKSLATEFGRDSAIGQTVSQLRAVDSSNRTTGIPAERTALSG